MLSGEIALRNNHYYYYYYSYSNFGAIANSKGVGQCKLFCIAVQLYVSAPERE